MVYLLTIDEGTILEASYIGYKPISRNEFHFLQRLGKMAIVVWIHGRPKSELKTAEMCATTKETSNFFKVRSALWVYLLARCSHYAVKRALHHTV